MPTRCPTCKHMNRDGARFCANCRTGLLPAPAPPIVPPGGTGQLPAQTLLNNRYLIIKPVGKGGMAAVYQAADTRIQGKTWAIKEMSTAAIGTAGNPQSAAAQFAQEAQLLATLDHVNIPKVTDHFTEHGRHYLVMEFVNGETLEEVQERLGRPLTETEVRPWLDQLCDVLHYLHALTPPIIFRDLKPSNIMLDRGGRIKLIDFGIARLFKSGQKLDTAQLGTEGFAAPEAYGKGQTDGRSDIYSLGATMYALLTADDMTQWGFTPPPIRQRNPHVSRLLDSALKRALDPDPARRWQSVAELKAYLGGPPPIRVAPPTQPAPRVPPLPPTPQNMIGGPPPSVNRRKPTTRLLMAVTQLTPRQLATAIGVSILVVFLSILILGPTIQSRFPWLWTNVPGLAIVGPFAQAASRRRFAAVAAHAPITLVGWTAWWLVGTNIVIDYGSLFIATLVSGLTLEGGMYFLPQVRGKDQDTAWKREMGWFALTAVITAVVFYVLLAAGVVTLGSMLSAAFLGALGWFLGDLVQEALFMQRYGMRRGTV